MTTWPRNIVHGDISRGLPFRDGSAVAIYSAHMLEHLYFDDARRALKEFRRLLSSGGVIRLALPDTEKLVSEFLAGLRHNGAEATVTFNVLLNAHPLSRPSGLRRLSARVGGSTHRWQPTVHLVRQMLMDAGFTNVVECEFRRGNLPDLVSVEHRAESFFLEATSAPTSSGK